VGTIEQASVAYEDGLRGVNEGLERLGASFDYWLALLLEQSRLQTQVLQGVVARLDAIRKTLESPLLTQARELFEIGCDRLRKGLLDKALDALLAAEEKDDTNYFIEYFIGVLQLYGIDEDDDVVDLAEARRHLLAAARFADAEARECREFLAMGANAYLHASISCHALSAETMSEGDAAHAHELAKEARALASTATTRNPALAEAWYRLAKHSALLGDTPAMARALEQAIRRDPLYTVKALSDETFDSARAEVAALLRGLTREYQEHTASLLAATAARARSQGEGIDLLGPTAQQAFASANGLLETAMGNADTGTFLGFVEAQRNLAVADQRLDAAGAAGSQFAQERANRATGTYHEAIESTNDLASQLQGQRTRAYELVKALHEESHTANVDWRRCSALAGELESALDDLGAAAQHVRTANHRRMQLAQRQTNVARVVLLTVFFYWWALGFAGAMLFALVGLVVGSNVGNWWNAGFAAGVAGAIALCGVRIAGVLHRDQQSG